MNYKMLYNPALLINEMILFGDKLLNMSVNPFAHSGSGVLAMGREAAKSGSPI